MTHEDEKERQRVWRNEYNKNPINKFKNNARRRANYLIESGVIQRTACEDCNEEKSEIHHEDYNLPDDIRFLCKICHAKWHTKHTPHIDTTEPQIKTILTVSKMKKPPKNKPVRRKRKLVTRKKRVSKKKAKEKTIIFRCDRKTYMKVFRIAVKKKQTSSQVLRDLINNNL